MGPNCRERAWLPCLVRSLGGGKGRKQLNWIEQEFENLKRFEEIIIATDMDEEGELAAEEIKKRFGDRCYRITLPTKDINELLQKQGYDGAKRSSRRRRRSMARPRHPAFCYGIQGARRCHFRELQLRHDGLSFRLGKAG